MTVHSGSFKPGQPPTATSFRPGNPRNEHTFVPGNPGGPGNPHARQTAGFRAALFRCVSTEDIEHIAHVLVREAKAGQRWAVKELLDRLIGRAPLAVQVEGSAPWGAGELLAVVVAALAEFPEARAKLAGRLRDLREGEANGECP
jgi:hypothetical protein